MQDEGKVYGFTISLYEYQGTIPTLWEATKSEFKRLRVCSAVDPCERRVYRPASRIRLEGERNGVYFG